jgi:hypothetical protein
LFSAFLGQASGCNPARHAHANANILCTLLGYQILKVFLSGLAMANQRSGDCDIDIAMNGPENCANNSSENSSAFRRVNKIPTLRLNLEKIARKVWKVGKDDPRRVIHAMKVGFALSVVSMFYLMDPLFKGVGDTAIWAIMTVVVVFEFTAGATLSKGLNRGIGTLLAGTLGVLVGGVAEIAETLGDAIIISASCFVLGAAATYSRFFPKVKSKYDYGVLIFLLTFNMITVSGYRFDNVFRMAYQRLATIAMGCAICVVISLFAAPIWAGDDLHKSITDKMPGLADSIEGCVLEYFKALEVREDGPFVIQEDPIFEGCRNVLDSKAIEESLANFASWEPRHGKFRFRHPWKQYVKVGGTLRHLAYCVVALHGCLRSEIQAPHLNRAAFKQPCTKVGAEVAQVLRQLSESIRCMKQCPSLQSLMETLRDAVEELNTALRLQPKLFNVIQPFYSPHQSHSAAEAKNLSAVNSARLQSSEINTSPETNNLDAVNSTLQSSQMKADSADPLVLIINDTDNCDEDKHKSSSEIFSGTIKELRSPIKGQDIASGRDYFTTASGRRLSISRNAHCVELAEALSLAAFASVLIEIAARVELVIEAVQELGKLAAFQP